MSWVDVSQDKPWICHRCGFVLEAPTPYLRIRKELLVIYMKIFLDRHSDCKPTEEELETARLVSMRGVSL